MESFENKEVSKGLSLLCVTLKRPLVGGPHLYLQSMLKLSWNTVIVPSALTVICRVSCTRKLFPEPWPIILKLFTNVRFAWPFCKEVLKLSCVTPVAWYLTPVVSPVPLMPCGWKWNLPLTLLPLMVNEIKVCRGPLRSTISPAPPAAQGIKTVRLMAVLSLTCTAALADTIMIASTATRHTVTPARLVFMGYSSKVRWWVGLLVGAFCDELGVPRTGI